MFLALGGSVSFKIVFGLTNQKKIKELNDIVKLLKALKLDPRFLLDYNIPEPSELHSNFLNNASYQAKYCAEHTKLPCMIEVIGLSIDALYGFPGVKSKEFIEECGGISNSINKLELMLNGYGNYSAHFDCALALYIPSHDLLIKNEARDMGSLSFPSRGETDFGFDSIFVPKGYDKIFAEFSIELKSIISHRVNAIQKLMATLQEFLNSLQTHA